MKFLLIGAGVGQLNLAKKIKERGHYLLIIGYNSIPDVIRYADKFIQQDLFLYDEVVNIARNEKIDAVVSDQHDIIAPLVAYVSECLGLPGNKYEMLQSYSNKNIFRNICDMLGVPCPKHIKLSIDSDIAILNTLRFPLIVKPADSQSSIGVQKVNSIDECKMALTAACKYSRMQEAIVEEFFSGQELVVEGFVWKGDYHNIAFGDRRYFELNNLFIPAQTIFPSIISEEVRERIIHYEQMMAEYVNPNFAIVHSEYLYDPTTDELRIVESGLRGGGVYISSHLIPLYSGIDINDMLLDAAEGRELNLKKILQNKKERASAYVCFYLPEGKIVNIEGVQLMHNLEFVEQIYLNTIKMGNKAPVLTNKGQRLGPILIKDKDRKTIEDDIVKIQKLLRISVIDNDGTIRGINWR